MDLMRTGATPIDASLGLDPSRALEPNAHAIGGRAPQVAVQPASREELCECLRACARDRLAAIPWGGGTELPHGTPPDRYDVALVMRGFDRVVEYEPADLTLTAECGATLASLRATLAARGQELPIETPFAERSTLGGALAANRSGPRRLHWGAPRDRILGAKFALSDGTLARTGGRVVKNVAGFALHRLLCGSRGALGAFVEASLKLAPAPAGRVALVFRVGGIALREARRWAFLPRLEPAAATVLGPAAARGVPGIPVGEDYALVILLEDDPAWVEQQAQQLEAALGRPSGRMEGEEAVQLARALCDLPARAPRRLTFTTAWNSPAALGVVLDEPASPGLVYHSLAGRLHLEPDSGASSSAVRRLAGSGYTLIDHCGVGPVEPVSPPFTALGGLRSRVRRALDPAGVWALGPGWERPHPV